MRLANHLTIRLIIGFSVLFVVWASIYFAVQMYEIYHDIDEGLTNLKQEFIVQANDDAEFVEAMEKYSPFNMQVEEITFEKAVTVREEHTTTKVYFKTEKEFEEVRILSTAFRCDDNGKYYSIQFFTSTVETDDLIENMLFLLVGLWVTLALVLYRMGRSIIERSSKPFHEVLKKLHAFSLDNTKMIELPQTNITEFKELNQAVEALLKENILAYKEQKKFIENASHELQTPLTVIINKTELMMDSKDISAEQMQELSAILANLNRMKRLNSSLLLLSKIRNKQFVENKPISIKKVVEEVCHSFEGIIEHKGLQLQLELANDSTVNMNSDLAHIMINNLVKNAINYNVDKGRIIIELSEKSLLISNDGKPIPDDINIFERYASNAESSTATGLGLSIVSSIAALYKFRIGHRYDQMHVISIFFQ